MKEKEKWKDDIYMGGQPFPWLYPNAGKVMPYGYPANYWNLWRHPERMASRTEGEVDFQRLQELYPSMARRLKPYVEEVCEHLEYPGSMMYDEYPDRLSLLYYTKNVWENACKGEDFGEQKPKWEQLQDLIGVLLLEEMLRRRQKRRERIGRGTY